MKILIAEDQILIQQDICKKIEKTSKQIEIVGTALNGQEAYQKILDLKPDILITDIRMPIQSGLELIRQIKEANISIKTVILSGYKDFEYTKEALHLGVDEYLLKPVSIEDLKYVLDILEEKIISEHDRSVNTALSSMFSSGISFPNSLQTSLHYKYYHLMLITLNSYATFSIQDWFPLENELDDVLKGQLVNKYLKNDEQVFICNGNAYNQKFLVLCLTRTQSERLDMMANELIKEIQNFTDSVTICISSCTATINSLKLEYKIMQNQLANHLIFAHSCLLHRQEFLSGTPSATIELDAKLIDSFIFCINTKNLKEYLKLLSDFLQQCKAKQVTQKYLEVSLKKLLYLCFNTISDIHLENKELEIDEYLSNARNYEELQMSLQLMFKQLFQQYILKQEHNSNPESMVYAVKEYIHNNYGKEININDIATHFHITAAYLSRIFKKYTNMRPIEYLTNYRIKQACEFFSHSQLTIREVSELCGYSNQFYFSKSFKQIMNVSPSEYQIQNQSSNE